jgi:nitroreductase
MPLLPAELPTAHASRALQIPFNIDQHGHRATSVPPLHEAIYRRRSIRAFSTEPIAHATVAEVLSLGHAAYHAHFGVRLRVLVAGLDPAEPWLPDLRAAFAPAPIFFLICGDVASGPSAWATALSYAGALGHALWLSATHLGLGGCLYGGSRAAVTAAVQRRDPPLRHLFTLALGHCR